MRLAKQELPESPCIPNEEVRLLRAKLIMEEALETIHALGFVVELDWLQDSPGGQRTHVWQEVRNQDVGFVASGNGPDLIEIADGCADLSVVTIGTLSACGISDLPLLAIVADNNMAKFGKGHSIREDGKLVKPPGHKPPDIAGVLKCQGWEG
jgi:predicted HAD superfamily Cof-like phosphohydrolase